MKDLIKEIEEFKNSCFYNEDYGNGYNDAITDIVDFLNKHLISTSKTIKLSEIIERLEKTLKETIYIEKYKDGSISLYAIYYDVDYINFNRIEFVCIKDKKIESLNINGDSFKWLYELWITETIIKNDIRGNK